MAKLLNRGVAVGVLVALGAGIAITVMPADADACDFGCSRSAPAYRDPPRTSYRSGGYSSGGYSGGSYDVGAAVGAAVAIIGILGDIAKITCPTLPNTCRR